MKFLERISAKLDAKLAALEAEESIPRITKPDMDGSFFHWPKDREVKIENEPIAEAIEQVRNAEPKRSFKDWLRDVREADPKVLWQTVKGGVFMMAMSVPHLFEKQNTHGWVLLGMSSLVALSSTHRLHEENQYLQEAALAEQMLHKQAEAKLQGMEQTLSSEHLTGQAHDAYMIRATEAIRGQEEAFVENLHEGRGSVGEIIYDSGLRPQTLRTLRPQMALARAA